MYNIWYYLYIMVDVAQLVRASVCGTEGCGFKPHLPPHFYNHRYG